MRAHIYVAGILCMAAAAPLAMAQSTPSPLTEAGTSTTCDQFKLSFQDLANCRMQWSTATSDAERLRVKNTYAARGGSRGSSTPPPNQTVAPGAGLSTGGIAGAVGTTPSSPTGITPQTPATSTTTPLGTSPSSALTPSAAAPLTSPSPSSTTVPAAPSPAIRTAPPPVSGTPGSAQ